MLVTKSDLLNFLNKQRIFTVNIRVELIPKIHNSDLQLKNSSCLFLNQTTRILLQKFELCPQVLFEFHKVLLKCCFWGVSSQQFHCFAFSRTKYQRTRLLSSTQWCSKERGSKKNPFWTSKLTTNLLKPFNIDISTHAIHPAWKMISLKAKQWDCLELTPQTQHLRRAFEIQTTPEDTWLS